MENSALLNVLKARIQSVYLPPVSKLYFDVMALQSRLQKRVVTVRISEPETWLLGEACQVYQGWSEELLLMRLRHIVHYLSGEQNVFAADYHLQLKAPIPYFEWQKQNKIQSITDYLGSDVVLYWLAPHEKELKILNELLEIYHFLQARNMVLLLVVGESIQISAMESLWQMLSSEVDLVGHMDYVVLDSLQLARLQFGQTSRKLPVFSAGYKTLVHLDKNANVIQWQKVDMMRLPEYFNHYMQL